MNPRSVFLSLFLVVALLSSLCCPALATADWEAAFSGFLYGMQAAAPDEDLSCFDYGYVFYDIDKDGIPELITQTGTCEVDYTGTVYCFHDGRVDKAGDFSLGHACLYSDPDRNGVIVSMGHMGWACALRYALQDGSLTEELLFEEELDFEQNPDAEYTEIESVIPGAEYLEMLPIMEY